MPAFPSPLFCLAPAGHTHRRGDRAKAHGARPPEHNHAILPPGKQAKRSAPQPNGHHLPQTVNKPLFEVADIARAPRAELAEKGKLNAHQKKVLTAICNCRTAELGGHRERCSGPACSHERFAYNGCRDRHCPKCNGMKREKWVADRKADALPVPYFHIVFTLPDSLESQCLAHGAEMYN